MFASYFSDNKVDALLHGHSYTANPISCAAALQAIRLMENSPNFTRNIETVSEKSNQDIQESKLSKSVGKMSNTFSDEELRQFSLLPGVEAVMGFGTVLALHLSSKNTMINKTNIGQDEFSQHSTQRGNPIVNTIVSQLKQDRIYVR